MLITLEEEIENYDPDIVVAAFVRGDLYRSTLPFRDYKKPYFKLIDNKLVLQNTPIGSPKEVLEEISRKDFISHSRIQLFNVYQKVTSDTEPFDINTYCDKTCQKLNTAIIDRMAEISGNHGANFLLVYLPAEEEIQSSEGISFAEKFFNEYTSSRPNIKYLNMRQPILNEKFKKARFHYTSRENRVVALKVHEHIKMLHAWKQLQETK
jgi:hypothetical protein